MKRILFFIIFTFVAITSWAYDVEVDGIYYNVVAKAKTAEVTSGDAKYTGSISIPSSIEYNGIVCSVTSIGIKAFYGCYDLKSVIIPNSVTSIKNAAFFSCNVTSVTIPNSVTDIGDQAFMSCFKLPTITIPNSVTNIGQYAFYNCESLTSATISNSVTSIGQYAFYNCESLTAVTIPNSVTSIEEYAFYGCKSLTSITIPNSVRRISFNAFYGCSSLTSLTIPNSVTAIGSYTFANCKGLTSVTIPNSVTSIANCAFAWCTNLISVTIPNSVTSIGERAFEGCRNLETVTCYATMVPSTNNDVFKDSYPEYATLVVPEEGVSAYRTTSPWSTFGSIKTIQGESLPEINKCATPTITYNGDDIVFACETDGATIYYTILPDDNKSGATTNGKVAVSSTYTVTAYAIADGYTQSEVASQQIKCAAGVVEVEKIVEVHDTIYIYDDTRSEIILPSGNTIVLTITNGILNIEDAPMNSLITIYTVDGEMYETRRVNDKVISIKLPRNAVYIIKVGEKTFKVKI